MFCQSQGSQGERRGCHLQRGPFRGKQESGSQEKNPGIVGRQQQQRAAAGCLPSQCLQIWPRLLSEAVCFLFILLPFFSSPPHPLQALKTSLPKPTIAYCHTRATVAQPHPMPALLNNLRSQEEEG